MSKQIEVFLKKAIEKVDKETKKKHGLGFLRDIHYNYIPLPRLYCKDGFSISVQVGQYSYSQPRKRGINIEYGQVELGYPNEIEPLIKQYAENKLNLTKTIYPFVPIKVVERLIEKHGGIDYEQIL